LKFVPGYNRKIIPISDIACHIDLNGEFLVDIQSNEHDSEVTISFGLLDFARVPDTKLANINLVDNLNGEDQLNLLPQTEPKP
jgi:hypothetical protein